MKGTHLLLTVVVPSLKLFFYFILMEKHGSLILNQQSTCKEMRIKSEEIVGGILQNQLRTFTDCQHLSESSSCASKILQSRVKSNVKNLKDYQFSFCE